MSTYKAASRTSQRSLMGSMSASKPITKPSRGASEHQSALSTQQSNNSMGSSNKLSARQPSSNGKRQGSNLSMHKTYKHVFQSDRTRQASISSASKFASADKRKMVCSLPRHTPGREQTSNQKPPSVNKVYLHSSSSHSKSKERASYAASVEDEPTTQIHTTLPKQRVVNPGSSMRKSTQLQNCEVMPSAFNMMMNDDIPLKSGLSQAALETKKAVLDQRFELIKKIDEGTYAKVYHAKDWKHDGKEVVVKLLRSRAMSSSSERE